MRDSLVLLAGVCAIGAAALFARLGLDHGTTALQLALWRLTVSSGLLVGWQAVRREPKKALERADRIRLIAAGAFVALHFLTWILSLRYESVARSTLLVSTAPLWAGLAGFFVGKRPRAIFWWGLAVAGLGLAIFTSQLDLGRGAPLIGDLLAVGGAILLVPYLLLSQRVQEQNGTARSVTWIYASGAVTLWLVALPSGQWRAPGNTFGWAGVLGMAVFSQLIGHTTLNWSLRRLSAAQVAAATLMEPVFAAFLAWAFLREAVSWVQAIGGLFILVGVGLAVGGKT